MIALMKEGRVKYSEAVVHDRIQECLEDVYSNIDFFKDKLILRPQEISNNPGIVRRWDL